MGTKRTLARITERFIWPGVAKDVYSMVSRFTGMLKLVQLANLWYFLHLQIEKCDVCQRVTKKLKTGVPELHPVPVVSTWHHLGIDFVGPLQHPSRQGNRFIFTVSDYFSKFVQAIPCPDKEASTVLNVLFKVC